MGRLEALIPTTPEEEEEKKKKTTLKIIGPTIFRISLPPPPLPQKIQ